MNSIYGRHSLRYCPQADALAALRAKLIPFTPRHMRTWTGQEN